MAGEASSYLLIFIASMVVAAGVAGLFTNEMTAVGHALEDRSDVTRDKFRTDIEVISEPGSPIHDLPADRDGDGNANVTVYVKNTGQRQLPSDPEDVTVLVDGTLQTGLDVTVVDDTEWNPGSVIHITFEYGSLAFGDHRVTVSVTGDQDSLEFRVG